MKANELRLGNYLEYNTPKYGWIETFCVSITYRNIESEPENYQPIPLTEEWLIRFGFESDFNGEYEILPFLYIWRPSSSTKSFSVSPNSDFPSTLKIKYVHQLQNLYFALTGEELTINQ